MIDVNKKGYISPNDLRGALKLFGYHPRKDTIYKTISQLDKRETGGIEFDEFIKVLTDKLRPCDNDSEEDYE